MLLLQQVLIYWRLWCTLLLAISCSVLVILNDLTSTKISQYEGNQGRLTSAELEPGCCSVVCVKLDKQGKECKCTTIIHTLKEQRMRNACTMLYCEDLAGSLNTYQQPVDEVHHCNANGSKNQLRLSLEKRRNNADKGGWDKP